MKRPRNIAGFVYFIIVFIIFALMLRAYLRDRAVMREATPPDTWPVQGL